MILVVGSTGAVGGMITRTLLQAGEPVRILVRPHSAYRALAESGAVPVFGDMKDRQSLVHACQGVDVVITTANSAARGGDDNVETVDLQGNRNLVHAARTAGVKQFIFTSVLGASVDSPVPLFQAKARTEEYLKASGMPYTILAPNLFMEWWVGTVVGALATQGLPVTLVGSGERKHSFVSARDVAAFAVAAARHPAAINRTIALGGPEPLSYRECVAQYEKATRRTIPIHTVAPGEPVPGLDAFVSGALAMFDTYDSPIDMSEAANTFGVRLTPLADVAYRQVVESTVAAHI